MLNFTPTITSSVKHTVIILAVCFTCVSASMQEPPQAYYVYDDTWVHGIPSGYMGERNGKSIALNDTCTLKPYKGKQCVRLKVDGSEAWCGIHIQYSGTWNVSLSESAKLADLSSYDLLEFYARAEVKAAEVFVVPEIGIGDGSTKEERVSDTYLELSSEWRKFTIPIHQIEERHRYNTLMYLSLPAGTIYLDEIRFVKKKAKSN